MRLLLLALALLGVLALAGCGKAATETAHPTTVTPTVSQPDPVSSIENLLDQAEQDADSATN